MRGLLPESVFRQAEHDPSHPALGLRDAKLTYAELATAIDDAAAGLVRLGLTPGQRVAVYYQNIYL